MNKLMMAGAAIMVLAGCAKQADEVADLATIESETVTYDMVGRQFYNEFIPCVAGPDYSRAAVDEMVAEWRSMELSDDLVGAWGYESASDDNEFDNGWWELQWTSAEAAAASWQQWADYEPAQAWAVKYQTVMACDASKRGGWAFHFTRDPASFGEAGSGADLVSSYYRCTLNEGKSMADVDAFAAIYDTWLDALEMPDGGFYAYGFYANAAQKSEVDLMMGHFHRSFESMQAGGDSWEATGGDAKAALEATVACLPPEVHNFRSFYDPQVPDLS